MELRDYLLILQRRWLIVAGVTALAIVTSGVFALVGPRAYEVTVRLAVSVGDPGVAPSPQRDAPPYVYYRDYYEWIASEYLADDLSQVIASDAFAAEVSKVLNEEVSREAIRDVTRVRKTHRILDVTVQANRPDKARLIASGILQVVQQKGPMFLAQLASSRAQVVSIDEPRVKAATTTGSIAVDTALRGGMGLFLGLCLAFVVDYLDSTLRSRKDVEQGVGLRVLGEIPALAR